MVFSLVNTVHLERPPGNFWMCTQPATVGIVAPGDFALKISHERVERLLPFVTSVPAGCVKFIEGAETHHGEWVVPFLLFSRFVPSWVIGTLDDIAHLLRPPGCVIECRWWKDGAAF